MDMIMMMKKMSLLLFTFTFLSLSSVSVGQQEYIGNETACSDSSLANGYSCNTSCYSFLTFRSANSYNTLASISDLLNSLLTPSIVASTNNISSNTDKIPFGQLIVVPVTCFCSGSISQYDVTYKVGSGDTYFSVADNTYQGLTSCQAILSQNSYNPVNISIGAKLSVPLRCACPNQNQINNHNVDILVTYIVQANDTLNIIGDTFGGVTVENLMEANMLSNKTIFYPFTPILVPLKINNCTEKPNSWYCRCPSRQLKVESQYQCNKIDQGKTFSVKWIASIGTGISLGLSSLVLFILILYRRIQKRKAKFALKNKMFEQNGGLILQQKLASFGNTDKARIFASEELERATENYSRSHILGQGGHGTVYKGMLEDGSIVVVKRSKALDKERIEQFVNEVVIMSQINHRNIVNLLGCCLETQVPILVYEYISNGTLSSHIHRDCETSLSWEDRFRVACEVAGAVAYMHSAASIPIFHRDIKPSNILLDENFVAKVSDFGTSRSVSYDKTHLTTVIQGTFGYLDPEYLQLSQFTDKSDVYSFGVVLVELLTGEKPVSFSEEHQQGRNTVANFVSMTKSGRLLETLHPRVVEEAKYEVSMAVAMLGLRCLKLNGKKRPSMKELTMELEGLRKSQKSGGELYIDGEDESFYRNDVQGVESRMSISIGMESTTTPR